MTHDREVLLRASDYLDYDVDMLVATALWLTAPRARNSLMSNAILESFLIHARTLIEFLSGTGHGNAVRAHHYFEELPQGSYVHQVSPFLLSIQGTISTHLAHLTTEPLDNLRSTIGWDVPRILRELWAGLEAFYDGVPSDRVLSDYDARRLRHRGRVLFFMDPSGGREPPAEQTFDSDFGPN